METEFTNTIFGISFPDKGLKKVEDDFELERSMDAYNDVEIYISKNVYKHDEDDDFNFSYRYAIEAYYSDEEKKTYYTLYLIPEFESLSDKKKKSIIDFVGDENVQISDVFDYGMPLVFGRTEKDGEYDKHIMDLISSVVSTIDRFIGFYLDKPQNRIGTDGWLMLDEYLHDVDSLKATLEKYNS